MSPDERRPTNPPTDPVTANTVPRRRFLTLGVGFGATLLAGCSTASDPGDGAGRNTAGTADGATTESGTFRLLISDQPVAIGDFDALDVTFDRARVFRGEGTGDEDEVAAENESEIADGNESEIEVENETEIEDQNESEVEDENETAAENESEFETGNESEIGAGNESETERDEPDGDGQRGFFILDLDGATVDLTQVVGAKAMGVFEGELPEGRYTKIELYAANVEGIVNGEVVNVTIPSGKLQIVKPFEVVAGETLEFVFDINVVKKGQTGEYNLLPVISESGVAGQDVEVEEVGGGSGGSGDADGGDGTDDPEEGDPGENAGEEGGDNGEGGGPPDDAGGDE